MPREQDDFLIQFDDNPNWFDFLDLEQNEFERKGHKQDLLPGDIQPMNVRTQISTNISKITLPKNSQQILGISPMTDHQRQKNQNLSSVARQQYPKVDQSQKYKRQYNSGVYSKNYREKRKQHMKVLQEENIFLKRKVSSLQQRLRQTQLQLNRIKFGYNSQQLDIQQLNQKELKNIDAISQNKTSPLYANDLPYSEEISKTIQFSKLYQVHGFGGYKKKQVLEYYMNEFLENVMRDREKYYFMNCIKGKDIETEKNLFDTILFQGFDFTAQENQNLREYYRFLKPMYTQLKDVCRQFYKDYQKVIKIIQRTHERIKLWLERDVIFSKKVLKMLAWFQANQYRKQMRELRAQWMNMVKSDQDKYQDSKQKKKKKQIKKSG